MTNNDVVVIKKYANRRLYNVESSKYITLQDLSDMVKAGIVFRVIDAKTEVDLTRLTLSQIIFEQEQKGYELLPNQILLEMIKFYNHPLSAAFAEFMLAAMKNFNMTYNHFHANLEGDSLDFYNNMLKMVEANTSFFSDLFHAKQK